MPGELSCRGRGAVADPLLAGEFAGGLEQRRGQRHSACAAFDRGDVEDDRDVAVLDLFDLDAAQTDGIGLTRAHHEQQGLWALRQVG